MATGKLRTGLIFGGRSCEHEISIMSAASVLSAIDKEKFEPIPFAIDKDGAWRLIETDLSGLEDLTDVRITEIFEKARRITLSDFDRMTDFAFPLLHGPWGEDGTIQGLFEMLGKPYAGCGVAAAAISMDKIFTKELWSRAGLPVCRHTYTTKSACADGGISSEAARIEGEIGYPIFVKPANMGSSIGISKVSDRGELQAAVETALRYDKRVIAEEYIAGREVEIALLGNDTPYVSAIGEILTNAVYYDYDSKYRGGAKISIPADIPDAVRSRIEAVALSAYKALDGEGFARIDLFYDEGREAVYLSEMNAIPGFTQYSMFPLLWQEKGLAYTELIERIIELGHERYNFKNNR